MTDLTNAEQWVRDAGETLVAHTRMNPPSGRCYCGHEVPLGHSFAEHQAAALGDLVAAREAQAAAKALHQVADDLESITRGGHSEGIKGWPRGDQNIYELAIEEASVKIHDRADQVEWGGSA